MISVSLRDDVAWVQLDRPERANALMVEDWDRLRSVMLEATECERTRAVVLRGTGTRHFCAGMDLPELRRAFVEPAAADELCRGVTQALAAITFCPKPTVAMVNGAAVGGGAEIALACDVRVAASTAGFRLPMSRIGVAIDEGSLSSLLALVGPGTTSLLLHTGDLLNADKAYAVGLFEHVVDASRLEEEVTGLVARITAGDDYTIATMKQMLAVAVARPPIHMWDKQMRTSIASRLQRPTA